MSEVAVSVSIRAPEPVVFAAFSDFKRVERVIESIIKVEILTDHPVGVGTKFRETRRMFGRESSETMTISEYHPPDSMLIEAKSCGAHYTSRYTFSKDPASPECTVVNLSFLARPTTVFSKIMAVLSRPMIKHVRAMLINDLEAMRDHLEKQQASPN